MIYLRIKWLHDNENEPTEILVELDQDRYELRKIEKFIDGKIGFSSEVGNEDCAPLSDLPIPSIEDINSDPQFEAKLMSASDFEAEWARASLRERG